MLVKVGLSSVSTEGAWKNLEAEQPAWDFEGVRVRAARAGRPSWRRWRYRGEPCPAAHLLHGALPRDARAESLHGRRREIPGKRSSDPSDGGLHELYRVLSLGHVPGRAPLLHNRRAGAHGRFHQNVSRAVRAGGAPARVGARRERDELHDRLPRRARDRRCVHEGDPRLRRREGARGDEATARRSISAGSRSTAARIHPPDRSRRVGLEDARVRVRRLVHRADGEGSRAEADYAAYIRRAQPYKNLFDPSTGFMRAQGERRLVDAVRRVRDQFQLHRGRTRGSTASTSRRTSGGSSASTEGGIAFAAKLDSLFATSPKITRADLEDVSGLVGQYAHGNEPSHHMAYLYAWAGQPWKTQALVRSSWTAFYADRPDGLIGNEDCGQMTAWYVFSALGFYPVNARLRHATSSGRRSSARRS